MNDDKSALSVRIDTDLKARIQSIADAEHRTLSQQIVKILTESLQGK
jgi:predicted transcriptional regulator